jgi:hypothetical protein
LNSHSSYLQNFCPWLRRRFLTRDLFHFFPRAQNLLERKYFIPLKNIKVKKKFIGGDKPFFINLKVFRWISLTTLFSTSHQTISGNKDYFFLILPEEREDERDEEDRVRIEEDFDTRGEDVLLNDREEVDDLILGEVDLT